MEERRMFSKSVIWCDMFFRNAFIFTGTLYAPGYECC